MSEASNSSRTTDENASLRAARAILGQDRLSQVQRNNVRHASRLSTLLFGDHRTAAAAVDGDADAAFVADDRAGGVHVLAVEDGRPVVYRYAGVDDADPERHDLLVTGQDLPTWLAYADRKWGLDRVLVDVEVA